MKITRSATSRAKPISWVTTNMVILESSATLFITFNTSSIISGSSAEVGSSNKRHFGFIAKERAIAIRCDCPPDNWLGKLLALSARPTLSNKSIANFLFSSSGRFKTNRGAIMIFSSTVLLAYKLKCWNTIPTFLRILFISVLRSAKSNPLTNN